MTVQPEPCTTSSARLRHYSTNLATGLTDVGRSGRTLCGEMAEDETETNRHHGTIWGRRNLIIVADLPECKRCARKLAATTGGS